MKSVSSVLSLVISAGCAFSVGCAADTGTSDEPNVAPAPTGHEEGGETAHIESALPTKIPPGSWLGEREYRTVANRAIPDNNPTGVTSSVDVSDAQTVASLRVRLNVKHTYAGDLVVTISHNGITRTLVQNEGGGSDDIARTVAVAGFEGQPVSGTWTVRVVDNAATDVGTLTDWSLLVTAKAGAPVASQSFAGEVRLGGQSIPDNNATGISSLAGIPSSVTSGRVSIALNISHTYVGDLLVTARHQSGYSRTLHNTTGGSSDNVVGTYPLSDFTGNPSGTWALTVVDRAAQDIGTLNSWSVTITK